MKMLLDCVDILIVVPCYLGYLWAAAKFCRKVLEASKRRERLFLVFSFCSWMFWNIVGRLSFILYTFSVLLSPISFIGLVALLFRSEREKRILAATMLVVVVRTVTDFCASFLFCLELFFQHTIKKIPEPFSENWVSALISGAGYCFAVLAICWMSKHLASVFCGKPRKWYIILAVPLLVVVTVHDVASLGASNGIMVRSGGNMGLYYDQLFSFAEFLVLDLLSMAAAGFYVFGMNRIYSREQRAK